MLNSRHLREKSMLNKKTVSSILFTLLLTTTFILLSPTFLKPCKANTTDVYPGQSIQEAIDGAAPGDTIFVHTGTYLFTNDNDYLFINKTLILIGENPTNTILDGNAGIIPIVRIFAPDVTFINFTVRNTASTQQTYGIFLRNTQNVTIANNVVKETYYGIRIENSLNCSVLNNTIQENYARGIQLISNGSDNLFIGNNIMENPTGLILEASDCQNNTFYHNNFISNTTQVSTFGASTTWDNGYPSGGNYWSDYKVKYPGATEIDDSGIWDTPYTDFGVNDTYPLMRRWGLVSPIARFTFTPLTPLKNEVITFNASASYDPDGIIISYEWNFGDDNTTLTTELVIDHSYPDYTNYAVKLTVTDNDTLTDSVIEVVAVQKKYSTLSIEVHPQTIIIGDNATVNGTLQPSIETNITIQYRNKGETDWKNLTETTTNTQGTYSYGWTPTILGIYELTAFWEGNETTLPAQSPIATLDVTKKSSTLTINVTPAAVTIDSNITITGTLTPSLEGVNITVSCQPIFKSWKELAVVGTDLNGNYAYNWTTTEEGMFILKASWPGDQHTFGKEIYSGFTSVTKASSEITISIEPTTAKLGSNATISGRITPIRAYVNVTIQFRPSNVSDSWNVTVLTDADGYYQYVWAPSDLGTYQIKARWEGDDLTSLDETEALTVNVVEKSEAPQTWQYAVVGILVIIILAGLVYLRGKKR
jgi:parallel beta-helix repeat protein